MGVMKMGNNVGRVGLEPTSLALRASVLPLHQVDPMPSLLYPHPHVHVALLPQRSVQTTTYLFDGLWHNTNDKNHIIMIIMIVIM